MDGQGGEGELVLEGVDGRLVGRPVPTWTRPMMLNTPVGAATEGVSLLGETNFVSGPSSRRAQAKLL